MLKHTFIYIFFSRLVLANESVHHGTNIAELKYYAINFSIFLAILMWKVYPLAKNYFREQHLLMKNHFYTASEKLRLAKIEKDKSQQDLDGLSRKITEMKIESQRDLDVFRVRLKKELEDKASVLKQDLVYQADFEGSALMNNLYAEVIDQVALSAEESVQKNSSERKVVTRSLVKKAGLR